MRLGRMAGALEFDRTRRRYLVSVMHASPVGVRERRLRSRWSSRCSAPGSAGGTAFTRGRALAGCGRTAFLQPWQNA